MIRETINPAPVPSLITVDAIDRAVKNAIDVLNARMDAQEKAVVVFQDNLTRVPTTVDRAVLGLRELLEARLNGIDTVIAEIHNYLEKRTPEIEKQIVHLHDLMMSDIKKLESVSSERFARIDTQFIERDKRTD